MTFWKLNSHLFRPIFIVVPAYFLLLSWGCRLNVVFWTFVPTPSRVFPSLIPSFPVIINVLKLLISLWVTLSCLCLLSSIEMVSLFMRSWFRKEKGWDFCAWSLLFDCRLKQAVGFLFFIDPVGFYDQFFWLLTIRFSFEVILKYELGRESTKLQSSGRS